MRYLALLLTTLVVGMSPLTAGASQGTPAAIACVAPTRAMTEGGEEADARQFRAGTPADPATTEQVNAAVANLIACRNAGDFPAYAALLTPNARLEASGDTDPDVLVAQLEAFDQPLTLQSLDHVQVHVDGRVSAELTYLFGPYELRCERWYFAERDGGLRLDAVEILPTAPPGTVMPLAVAVLEGVILLDRAAVSAAPYLVLQVENGGEEPHEVLVTRLPAGVEPEALGEGEALANYVGEVFLFPGTGGELVLAALPPGEYALLCLLDGTDGSPHAAQGEAVRLSVVPASASAPVSERP